MDPRRLYWYYVRNFRRKVRTFMSPRTADEAQEKRELFAKLYTASAFVTTLVVIYIIGKNNVNFNYGSNSPTAVDVINKMGISGNVKVIRFEGFKKVDEYIYNRKKPDEYVRDEKPDEYVRDEKPDEKVDSEILLE